VNAHAEVRNDSLLTIWRDLTTEPVWKYEESPPFLLSELTKLNLVEASDGELSRAMWFWLRRPKMMFPDSVALSIVASCVIVSAVIALVNWPGTSIPKRVTELSILLFEVAFEIYLVVQRIRFVRWRREYELSIDRLIRSIHSGV
jgi:hypothetical protein